MDAHVIGMPGYGFGHMREKADVNWAHLSERRGVVAQETLEELSLSAIGRGVEPEVKVEIVNADIQRDVEHGRQAANCVWEATDRVFKRIGRPADFCVEPARCFALKPYETYAVRKVTSTSVGPAGKPRTVQWSPSRNIAAARPRETAT
jgi:hypothetical protein